VGDQCCAVYDMYIRSSRALAISADAKCAARAKPAGLWPDKPPNAPARSPALTANAQRIMPPAHASLPSSPGDQCSPGSIS
jgi:hypothetical protein